MNKEVFEAYLNKYAKELEEIKQSAHVLHDSVNQQYDHIYSYGLHLDMVADRVRQFGFLVCQDEQDVIPMLFGAYYHDSMEDARVTYNDVMAIAKKWMNDQQALLAAEIVYALTNEKGRNRAERANDKYYQGIRETPYAPFTKMADRMANFAYSCRETSHKNTDMKAVYLAELPHFLEAINPHAADCRLQVPQEMVDEMMKEKI